MYPDFWRWLIKGLNGKAGYWSVVNWLLLSDFGIALFFAFLIDLPVQDFAPRVLVPLSGILFGLTFAWVGTATALLSDKTIEAMAEHNEDGVALYVYKFQLSVLISLSAVVAWGLSSSGITDRYDFLVLQWKLHCTWPSSKIFASELFLYFISSFCVRICWQTILGAHALILTRNYIRIEHKKRTGDWS